MASRRPQRGGMGKPLPTDLPDPPATKAPATDLSAASPPDNSNTKKRPRTIETIARASLKKKSKLSDCDPQNNSPLFNTLSPEIRNQIFDLVFEPTVRLPNEAALIETLNIFQSFPCVAPLMEEARTGFTIDTVLLRTCRRVYVEARFIPARKCVVEFVSGPLLVSRVPSMFYFTLPLPSCPSCLLTAN